MQKSKPRNITSVGRRSTKNFPVHIVLVNSKGTAGNWLMSQMDKAYESGKIRAYCRNGNLIATSGQGLRLWQLAQIGPDASMR